MPKFKKVCSNPLHSEWQTEAVKDLTKFGGLQPFIKAFQSLAAELGGKCSTIFCVNCLKTCRQKKIFTQYLALDENTRFSANKVYFIIIKNISALFQNTVKQTPFLNIFLVF